MNRFPWYLWLVALVELGLFVPLGFAILIAAAAFLLVRLTQRKFAATLQG